MGKILLVEDDSAIREALNFSFENSPHEFITAKSIKEAKAVIYDGLSLVLLDVSLTDGNGFDFYKSFLQDSGIATIFLTARDDENDIVKGLELGAEDYITKPFSVKELMARVNRVMLRQEASNVIKVRDLEFDPDRMEVKKAGETVSLSSLELKIVQLMFENQGKVVSRDAVIDCIWETTGNDVYDHTVTVYVKRIREKLGVDSITTIKGVGYRL